MHSTDKSPVRYNAFDPELQRWVAACLVYGVLDARQRLRGDLPRDQLERLYRELTPLGTTLQVRPETRAGADRDAAVVDAAPAAPVRPLPIDGVVFTYPGSAHATPLFGYVEVERARILDFW